MRLYKRTALLLIIATVSLAHSSDRKPRQTEQPALKTRSRDSKHFQVVPRVEVIATIPRYEVGRYDLGDIALLDTGDAWAVGYDGEHVRRVYYSRDRGKGWNAVDVPGNDFTLNALDFSDSQHGWAVGGSGLIIRTTNGGKSWELLRPPTSSELHAVHFANSRIGYVAGRERVGDKITDELTGTVEIFCTKDGGETWKSCYKENEPGTVFQITNFSEAGAFVVLNGNRLIRTDDQGATWRPVDLSSKHVASVALAGNGVHWVVGRNGMFERSDNGGRTWRKVSSLADGKNWWGIAFNTAGTGVAVGDGGLMAVTLDNGKTWQLPDTGIRDHLRAVRLRGNYAIILGAKKVYSATISAIASDAR
ncbi:MAG TPA: YCF48-related protein [Blastocatellia bacterium]|nr:YCF48-related protein [Blastocatellia bacterium]